MYLDVLYIHRSLSSSGEKNVRFSWESTHAALLIAGRVRPLGDVSVYICSQADFNVRNGRGLFESEELEEKKAFVPLEGNKVGDNHKMSIMTLIFLIM